MCRVAVASASVAASSASRRVSRSAAAAAPAAQSCWARSSAPSASRNLLRERLAGRSTLRALGVVLCLMLRELGGRRRHLGRMLPLRFLERCLRVGQVLREGLAVGALPVA